MAASIEQFFQSYAQVLNRWVGERDGLDAVRAHLADSFVVATPNGEMKEPLRDEDEVEFASPRTWYAT